MASGLFCVKIYLSISALHSTVAHCTPSCHFHGHLTGIQCYVHTIHPYLGLLVSRSPFTIDIITFFAIMLLINYFQLSKPEQHSLVHLTCHLCYATIPNLLRTFSFLTLSMPACHSCNSFQTLHFQHIHSLFAQQVSLRLQDPYNNIQSYVYLFSNNSKPP